MKAVLSKITRKNAAFYVIFLQSAKSFGTAFQVMYLCRPQ